MQEVIPIAQGNDRGNGFAPYTKTTFQALVQAILPPAPVFEVPGGERRHADLEVDEYVMWELDHSFAISSFSLSRATAHLLNRGAIQLVLAGRASPPQIGSRAS